MTKTKALETLKNDGWNKNGALAIIDALIDDGMLENITEKELLDISEDYKDR